MSILCERRGTVPGGAIERVSGANSVVTSARPTGFNYSTVVNGPSIDSLDSVHRCPQISPSNQISKSCSAVRNCCSPRRLDTRLVVPTDRNTRRRRVRPSVKSPRTTPRLNCAHRSIAPCRHLGTRSVRSGTLVSARSLRPNGLCYRVARKSSRMARDSRTVCSRLSGSNRRGLRVSAATSSPREDRAARFH